MASAQFSLKERDKKKMVERSSRPFFGDMWRGQCSSRFGIDLCLLSYGYFTGIF